MWSNPSGDIARASIDRPHSPRVQVLADLRDVVGAGDQHKGDLGGLFADQPPGVTGGALHNHITRSQRHPSRIQAQFDSARQHDPVIDRRGRMPALFTSRAALHGITRVEP